MLNRAVKECVDVVLLVEACEGLYDPSSFDKAKIMGDWRLGYQLDSKALMRSQKVLTGHPSDSNFITDEKGRRVFRNYARLSKKSVTVVADVVYAYCILVVTNYSTLHSSRSAKQNDERAIFIDGERVSGLALPAVA